MSIVGSDHTVLLVRDIEEGIQTYRDRFNMVLSHRAGNTDVGINQAFFALADGTFLELIAPIDQSSPLHQVVESRGEGVHVLALKVEDLASTVAQLRAENVELVGVGTPQVFIHPKSAHGVMIQLWPIDRKHRWRDGN